MFTEGAFKPQLANVEVILKKLELFEERQLNPNKTLGAAHFRRKTYREIYEISVEEFAYDFRLADQSLLMFLSEGSDVHSGHLSYSFLEAPFEVSTYIEFVSEVLGVSPDDQASIDLIGDSCRADYDQYLNSSQLKSIVTPVRYDYEPKLYKSGRHPASHIHFGFLNDIRLSTEKIMNPVSFVLFIIRQRYPDKWMKLLQLDDATIWCKNIRLALQTVHNDYWGDLDNQELICK